MMAFEQAVIVGVTKQPLVMYVEVSRFVCSIIAYLHNKGTSSIALTRVNTRNISSINLHGVLHTHINFQLIQSTVLLVTPTLLLTRTSMPLYNK